MPFNVMSENEADKILSNYADADGKSEAGAFAPSKVLLQTVAREVFFASLQLEEGRPALCRVQFRNEGPRVAWSLGMSEAVSAAVLRKLSPFMTAPGVALCINERGHIAEIGVGIPTGAMAVFAERAGRLVVSRGTAVVAVLEEGQWLICPGRANPLRRSLIESLGFANAEVLSRILLSSRRHRRGGLLIIRGDSDIPVNILSEPRYPVRMVEGRTSGASVDDELEEAMHHLEMLGDHHPTLLAMISFGAGIDGATVLDRNMNAIGFGAKIHAPGNQKPVYRFDNDIRDFAPVDIPAIGGMRHQSAAKLVQSVSDATAFAISQDGPIAIFQHERQHDDGRGGVTMIPNVDRNLEAEWAFRIPEA